MALKGTNIVQIPGVLEIDLNRNVIYFHSEATGNSVLRMHIDRALPLPEGLGVLPQLLDVRILRELSPADGETPINTAHVSWGDG